MSFHTIDVRIADPYGSALQPELLRRAAEATLLHQQIDEPCELVLVVTGDEALRQLNQRYRSVDAPTDVLAFPNQSEGPAPSPTAFVDAPGLPRYLGDVLISFPRAETQAEGAAHTLHAELQLLVVHGILHLLGYDDRTEPQRKRMWDAQRDILGEMGIRIDLPE
ncbi:MAG: rRNA maturation RNase YbeY [Chloroflexota bacterium]